MNPETRTAKHIRLTSHPAEGAWGALPIRWGRADPKERGPVDWQRAATLAWFAGHALIAALGLWMLGRARHRARGD